MVPCTYNQRLRQLNADTFPAVPRPTIVITEGVDAGVPIAMRGPLLSEHVPWYTTGIRIATGLKEIARFSPSEGEPTHGFLDLALVLRARGDLLEAPIGHEVLGTHGVKKQIAEVQKRKAHVFLPAARGSSVCFKLPCRVFGT
jgi:hypothetical protein